MNIAESILMKFKREVYREKLNQDITEAHTLHEWEEIMNKYSGKSILTEDQEKIIGDYVQTTKWIEERNKKIDKRYKILTITTVALGITAMFCLIIFK